VARSLHPRPMLTSALRPAVGLKRVQIDPRHHPPWGSVVVRGSPAAGGCRAGGGLLRSGRG